MENQILTDPLVKPEKDVLEKALGKQYKLFEEYSNKIIEKKLVFEWTYYNDGKSWLCKTLHKKKNMCWLSVWNTGFKLTFYFTEKTIEGIYDLEIGSDIKKAAKEAKPIGKLIPVLLLIKDKKAMDDGLKLLDYKMTLK
jgi:hypothetical protein